MKLQVCAEQLLVPQKHAQSRLIKYRKAVHCFKSIRMAVYHSGRTEYLVFTTTQNKSLYVLAVYCQAEGSVRFNYLTLVMLSTRPLH